MSFNLSNSSSSTAVPDIDEYAIGSLPHHLLWTIYVTFNVIGSALCLLFLNGIYLLPSRTSADIFVGGLCSGCIFMSVQCATQCLLSMYAGQFAYGEVACQLESFFHFTGVLTQFFCITLLAFRNYLAVIRMKTISSANAIRLCIFVWALASLGTYLVGSFSEPRLLPSGTYCLYAFTSPAFRYWFMPVISVALASVIWLYWRIFWGARAAFAALRAMQQQQQNNRGESGVIRPRQTPPSQHGSISRPAAGTITDGTVQVGAVGGIVSLNGISVRGGGGSNNNSKNSSNNNNSHDMVPESPTEVNPTTGAVAMIGTQPARSNSPSSTTTNNTLPSDRPPANRSVSIELSNRVVSVNAVAPEPPQPPQPRPMNREMARARAAYVSANRAGHAISLRLARRSILFVGVFAVGWAPPIICFLYEAIYDKPVPEGMDISVAIAGTFHSIMVPLAYGYNNAPLRAALRNRWPRVLSCLVSAPSDDSESMGAPRDSSLRYRGSSTGGQVTQTSGVRDSRLVLVQGMPPSTAGAPAATIGQSPHHAFGIDGLQSPRHASPLFHHIGDPTGDTQSAAQHALAIHAPHLVRHHSRGSSSASGGSGNNSPNTPRRHPLANFSGHRRQNSTDSTQSNSTSNSSSSTARSSPFVAGTNATSRIVATSIGTNTSGPGVTITVTPASPPLAHQSRFAAANDIPVYQPPPTNPFMTFLAPPGGHGQRKKKKRTPAEKKAREAAKAARLAAKQAAAQQQAEIQQQAALAALQAHSDSMSMGNGIPLAPMAAGLMAPAVPLHTPTPIVITASSPTHASLTHHPHHHHHHHHHHGHNTTHASSLSSTSMGAQQPPPPVVHHHTTGVPRRTRSSIQPFRDTITPPLMNTRTRSPSPSGSQHQRSGSPHNPGRHVTSPTHEHQHHHSTPVEMLAEGAIGATPASPGSRQHRRQMSNNANTTGTTGGTVLLGPLSAIALRGPSPTHGGPLRPLRPLSPVHHLPIGAAGRDSPTGAVASVGSDPSVAPDGYSPKHSGSGLPHTHGHGNHTSNQHMLASIGLTHGGHHDIRLNSPSPPLLPLSASSSQSSPSHRITLDPTQM